MTYRSSLFSNILVMTLELCVCVATPRVAAGSLRITWAQVIIGVESGLLMFPINILIITIFRSIRPRLQPPKAPESSTQQQKAAAVAMPTLLKVCFQTVAYVRVCFMNSCSLESLNLLAAIL